MFRRFSVCISVMGVVHQFSDSGVLDTSGESTPDSCKWLLRTEQGFGIRLTLDEFAVSLLLTWTIMICLSWFHLGCM